MSDSLDDVLVLLKARYRQVVTELEAVKGTVALNTPEVKSQDGGTTIAKYEKIKQLEQSMAAAAKAIRDHIALQDVIDEGGEPFTFTLESQQQL